jgi:hypothetical protein
MLHEVGHKVMTIELYSYSCYEQPELSGRDVTNFWKMVADPTGREYITTLSRRGETTTATGPAPDWRTLFVETERYWDALRRDDPELQADDLVDREPLLVQLQRDVIARDQMLADLQEERNRSVESRDRIIADQQEERTRAVEIRDRMIAELHEERTRAVETRDRTIADLNERIGILQRTLNAKLSEIVKRKLRRITKT